jgi:hypothetical protein
LVTAIGAIDTNDDAAKPKKIEYQTGRLS